MLKFKGKIKIFPNHIANHTKSALPFYPATRLYRYRLYMIFFRYVVITTLFIFSLDKRYLSINKTELIWEDNLCGNFIHSFLLENSTHLRRAKMVLQGGSCISGVFDNWITRLFKYCQAYIFITLETVRKFKKIILDYV